MKYLSFDIEATGLRENDYIIEFGMVPFDSKIKSLNKDLAKHYFIKCPSFEELKPELDPWVVEHNESLIKKAHSEGIELKDFAIEMKNYLESEDVKKYFGGGKIFLFGKSLNAIDIPFLNRDLGWKFMREYFSHQQLDLSSIVLSYIDSGHLPEECISGSKLMNFLEMGDVCHTAMEDAENTAIMYFKLLEKFSPI